MSIQSNNNNNNNIWNFEDEITMWKDRASFLKNFDLLLTLYQFCSPSFPFWDCSHSAGRLDLFACCIYSLMLRTYTRELAEKTGSHASTQLHFTIAIKTCWNCSFSKKEKKTFWRQSWPQAFHLVQLQSDRQAIDLGNHTGEYGYFLGDPTHHILDVSFIFLNYKLVIYLECHQLWIKPKDKFEKKV